ncbi:MAG: hypothetical protein DCC75_04385 [Proteobacteria bacterium]|nr:MAG: hypothetical protein DCC75_04385 [Pseudomonadota bacterium]
MRLFITAFLAGIALIGGEVGAADHAHTLGEIKSREAPVQLSSNALSKLDLSVSSRIPQAGSVKLERLELRTTATGTIRLLGLPEANTTLLNRIAGVTSGDDYVFLSLDPRLQAYTDQVVKQAKAPHVSVVVMDPRTGKILALSDKSSTIPELSLHAGFPAASLFKIITAAAALEKGTIKPLTKIFFRGGNYTLDKWNYKPSRHDKRSMTVAEALGKSVNPVFGRIALQLLSPRIIRSYTNSFGFNSSLDFDVELPTSKAHIPESDFSLSRTAAGFGDVYISPIHAAAIVSALANRGVMPRPYLVDKVVSPSGNLLYASQPSALQRIVQEKTADLLLQMMEYTTTVGTSSREFRYKNKPVLKGIPVAAKTGTLSGRNPKGINNWFVATAPLHDPQVAVSVIVVNPGGISSKASHIGRLMIQKFFE